MTTVTLGTKIRVMRALNGWTIHQLAELSGITRNPLSEYERNKRAPSPKNLERIQAVFGIDFNDPDVEMAFSILANERTARRSIQAALACLERRGVGPVVADHRGPPSLSSASYAGGGMVDGV